MIRKITNNEQEAVLKVLNNEPAFNLFAIGDIEIYGCENEIVEVWAQYDNDEIVGVLLRYNTSFIFYFVNNDVEANDFVDIVKKHKVKPEVISGRDQTLERIEKYFEYESHNKMYFCKLDKPIDKSIVDDTGVEIATIADAEQICKLQNSIEEFSVVSTVEMVTKKLEDNFGRIYCIKNEDGEIISMAQTTAENSTAAMIVGVCTHVDYRKQGLMSKVMLKLCYDLQREDKLTCLFYDNKGAGKIYHSIGFETMGMWHMLRMNK